ncbi:MAG: GNAT family N-acetyltransferase [Candidatus Limnocylindrales bacterium]
MEDVIDATRVTIRRTRDTDVRQLPAVERSAARSFATVPGLEWIVDDDVLDEARHRRFAAAGWSWVADIAGAPVGFVCGELIEREVHVWEVAVGEAYQQQGIGSRLMARIEAQAREAGARALTLTTFSDVPWNGPFYASLGYEVIDPEACGPRLRRILELEAQAGIPADHRCAMRLCL